MIVKKGNRYQVRSHDGKKNLGTYSSHSGAVKRLAQVERFKKMK